MKPGATVPWLTTPQTSEYLGFASMAGFYSFVARERKKPSGLRVYWLRGRMRFRQVDLDRCLEVEGATAPRRIQEQQALLVPPSKEIQLDDATKPSLPKKKPR